MDIRHAHCRCPRRWLSSAGIGYTRFDLLGVAFRADLGDLAGLTRPVGDLEALTGEEATRRVGELIRGGRCACVLRLPFE